MHGSVSPNFLFPCPLPRNLALFAAVTATIFKLVHLSRPGSPSPPPQHLTRSQKKKACSSNSLPSNSDNSPSSNSQPTGDTLLAICPASPSHDSASPPPSTTSITSITATHTPTPAPPPAPDSDDALEQMLQQQASEDTARRQRAEDAKKAVSIMMTTTTVHKGGVDNTTTATTGTAPTSAMTPATCVELSRSVHATSQPAKVPSLPTCGFGRTLQKVCADDWLSAPMSKASDSVLDVACDDDIFTPDNVDQHARLEAAGLIKNVSYKAYGEDDIISFFSTPLPTDMPIELELEAEALAAEIDRDSASARVIKAAAVTAKAASATNAAAATTMAAAVAKAAAAARAARRGCGPVVGGVRPLAAVAT